MDEQDIKKLYDGMLKKAAGYEAVETQEEFALVDGQMQLVKRKVTVRDVPPDIAAFKLLVGEGEGEPIGKEELEKERAALTEAFYRQLEQRLNKEGNEPNGTD